LDILDLKLVQVEVAFAGRIPVVAAAHMLVVADHNLAGELAVAEQEG
jgi:hypothetical protein